MKRKLRDVQEKAEANDCKGTLELIQTSCDSHQDSCSEANEPMFQVVRLLPLSLIL